MPMDETFRVENITCYNYSSQTPMNGSVTLRHNSSKTELKIALTVEDCGRILEIFRDRASAVLTQAAQACLEEMKTQQIAAPIEEPTTIKAILDDEIPF